ncbi:PucR C-terminal helix-turn-helix domain-containing protein [Streptosporangium subroseum]|uniref:PucR C-terminal helix-turn-helix domain-containing protein n=1 Tax=Streptosporangium subroseum TaxID=106412 RepID=A0A239K0F8_9ACTN|nr:helix-turn-helix domain-containing protein [Streptosporangium subroseum]SNT11329.1 PucR C-terminal helix-turn-helix domain-containing protein [Streptosporangium subroseum]
MIESRGRRDWEVPVTVAELVNGGPLAGARMWGTGENPVRQVRIVDDLATLGSVPPHTAVVLVGQAASGGWAVEMAMRRAWEQAAACVIASSAGMSAGSGAGLAERLGVTLIFVDEDPLVTAVRVASAAARPEAARTQLVARCATRLAEAGPSARRVLGVLNSELQGNAVALLDPWGSHLAGRRAQGPSLAEVDIPDASGGTLAILVAHGSFQSPGWPSVVNAVLALAVTPLIAWAAIERLAAERDVALQSALATRLLTLASSRTSPYGRIGDGGEGAVPQGAAQGTPPEADLEASGDGTLARAVALRWPVAGPLTAYAIRPHDADLDDLQMIGSVIAATVGPGPVLRREESWAGWSALPPERLAIRLAECLAALPMPCAAGVGAQVPDLGIMDESLLGAEAAAFVSPAGVVARADRMGPAKLLAALPGGVLRAPAQMILGPLLSVDRDGTLLETLTAVLDEGGASRAAERLGVHRNTVTTRLERIRAAGFDVDDPGTRLALHLAAHVLRSRPVG